MRNGSIVFTQKVDYEPPCVSINRDLTEVAVGGAMVNIRPFTRGKNNRVGLACLATERCFDLTLNGVFHVVVNFMSYYAELGFLFIYFQNWKH